MAYQCKLNNTCASRRQAKQEQAKWHAQRICLAKVRLNLATNSRPANLIVEIDYKICNL